MLSRFRRWWRQAWETMYRCPGCQEIYRLAEWDVDAGMCRGCAGKSEEPPRFGGSWGGLFFVPESAVHLLIVGIITPNTSQF